MKLLKISVLKNQKNIKNHCTLFKFNFYQSYLLQRQLIGNLFRRSLIKNTV